MVQPTGRYYRGVDLAVVPTLPENLQVSYVAEGAANIIYRFKLPSSTSNGASTPESAALERNVDKTHLLRLRKTLPSGTANLPAFAALQKIFFPLLPKELVLDTQLVRIPRDLIDRENKVLLQREAEGTRLAKRAGLYLVGPPPPPGTPLDENGDKLTMYERYAFLVEDMTPTPAAGEAKPHRQVLVEFKTKWLLQSPGAPEDWRRCRTCALRLSKDYKKHKIHVQGNGVGAPGYWCPFDLASGEHGRVRLAVRGILSHKGAVLTGWKNGAGVKGKMSALEEIILENKVVEYFLQPKGRELLALLKKYQQEWDPKGAEALFGKNGDQNLGEVRKYLMAMTIRDLTLFLKVDLSSEAAVQARMGDLDLKSCENGKAKYWVNTEVELKSGGWYNGTESYPVRRKSMVGDKRKIIEVDGKIVDGRKKSSQDGGLAEIIIEQEAPVPLYSDADVRWCAL
ncbi:inositol-pentakisphosphate 2-kinase-domain-containing protein [Peziza echinospora]|nr:inositol-pentakisphosphate 2-kinase-domain-containing protein [Peziza echinospora]